MSLYFDCVVENPYKHVTNTHVSWHPVASCLAVASFNEDKGGIVSVYTGEGKACDDVDIPPHSSAQVTTVVWHPIKRILAIGWQTGELYIYNDHEHELHEIQSLHRSPISVLHFSHAGRRLISADTSGSLVGWNADGGGVLTKAFTHDLTDSLSEVVFRVAAKADHGSLFDFNGLAKAAVGGDEFALDIFSSWRPRTGHKRTTFGTESKDNLNFFLGSTTGVVYHVNELGQCDEVLQAEGGVKRLLHHSSKNILVVITEGLVLGQFTVELDGSLKEVHKVKLSGRSSDIKVTWATEGFLAVSTGDGFIRLWSLETGYNFVLDLREAMGYRMHEHISCVSYSPAKKTLAAGTNLGNVAMWKKEEYTPVDGLPKDPEKEWKLQPPTSLAGVVTEISWGSSLNLLAVNTVSDVFIFHERDMVSSYSQRVSVVQMAPSRLSVDVFSLGTHIDLKADIQIRGVQNTDSHIVIWSNKRMVVYEINADGTNVRVLDSFMCDTDMAVVHENSIYSIEGNSVQVHSFQGSVKQSLSFRDVEGDPIGLDVCGNFLVAFTLTGTVRLWDLSRREAKIHHQGKKLNELFNDFGEIISVRCNCSGDRVSFLVARTSSLIPDQKLYVWDIESDVVTFFNFASGRSEEDDLSSADNPGHLVTGNDGTPKELTHQDRSKAEAALDVQGRYVVTHMWDAEDSRLLICEPPVLLVSFFVSAEQGIVVQDTFALSPNYSKFLGCHVPFLYLINSIDNRKEHYAKLVTAKTMRDFVGLEECDGPTKIAMVDFSFYLSIGNMDEAFRAIKGIKSETVWENMAKMCVKTKRMDVATLCLGNIGHARGARALRAAMKEPELDAKVAALALQLGLFDEAEQLYKGCQRWDLLNEMYQNAGLWSKAIEIADKEDRIHLRSTHYNFAKHLESKLDFSGAIDHYEKSDTYRFEVPRMLFDELPTLEDYIMHTDDKGLRRWWAQYLESTGEMETALQFYEAAGDHLSLVRVHCYCNNLDKAAEIANSTADKAACYHLARQYENVDMVKEAIHFFSRAQAYGSAIRICKENAFDDQLMNLALLAGSQEQVEAARYFVSCERPQLVRAVTLYHKAGLLAKAVDLAFESGQVATVAQIASELDKNADPGVVQRCAQYFISIKQFDKAVNLLVTGEQLSTALDLAVEHNVPITEELAERFTLPSEHKSRTEILEKVAECAYAQENYILATKKFTQAGSKVKAMKCLLKSGETDRVIYFANVCRQPEIYILAANYLQTLDIRQRPGLVKDIVQFYTKANAPSLLSAFYDSCAQIEIDEYQNYDKALQALKEAYKCIADGNTAEAQRAKPDLAFKLNKIQSFVNLKSALTESGKEGGEGPIKDLRNLLAEEGIETAVRKGDIYGSIVEYYATNGNFKTALATLQEMKNKKPKVKPSFYVSREALEAIGQATGVPIEDHDTATELDIGGAEAGSDDEVSEEDGNTTGKQSRPLPSFLRPHNKFL